MSLVYILDGYNVLHSTHRWVDMPRENQRLAFLRYLEDRRPAGSARNTLLVVFDGFAAGLRGLQLSSVQILFSGHRDADALIKETVADLPHPKDAVVVTNDRGIRAVVRRIGARVISCEEFFGSSKRKKAPHQEETLDAVEEENINRELRRLWKL